MTGGRARLWPYSPMYALIAAPVLFSLLLVFLGLLRGELDLPANSDGGMIWIILLISFLPVALLVFDAFGDRAATIEYMGIKLALSGAAAVEADQAVQVPTNIGVPAQPVTDSNTTAILEAIRVSVRSEVVVIDLAGGKAWWDTRLLVLLAGAERHRQTSAVVFLATAGGVQRRFQGWGKPGDLLSILLDADRRYRMCYLRAQAASAQWALVEPTGDPNVPPPPQHWMTGRLASGHAWMVYEHGSVLPNPFAFEQFLANELGNEIELQGGSKWVNVPRLRDLFTPVLRVEGVEVSDAEDERIDRVLKASGRYVAQTHEGVFQDLVRKDDVLFSIVRDLVKHR